MENFYISAWVLLAVAAFVSLATGTANWAALVIYSLIALALVHALMLWTLFDNTREYKTG